MERDGRSVQPREVHMKTKPIIMFVVVALSSVFAIVAPSDSARAGQLDPKCFTECNKNNKACTASCGTNTTCINACIATFRQCTSGCSK